jgi:hypothetical protein
MILCPEPRHTPPAQTISDPNSLPLAIDATQMQCSAQSRTSDHMAECTSPAFAATLAARPRRLCQWALLVGSKSRSSGFWSSVLSFLALTVIGHWETKKAIADRGRVLGRAEERRAHRARWRCERYRWVSCRVARACSDELGSLFEEMC